MTTITLIYILFLLARYYHINMRPGDMASWRGFCARLRAISKGQDLQVPSDLYLKWYHISLLAALIVGGEVLPFLEY